MTANPRRPLAFSYTGPPEEELTSFGVRVPRKLLHKLHSHLDHNQMTVRAWFVSVLEQLPEVPDK